MSLKSCIFAILHASHWREIIFFSVYQLFCVILYRFGVQLQIGIKYRFSVRLLFILKILKFPLAICPHDVYNIDMTIVNTATLKQQLSHYLGLARQGKDVLITSHKRVIAHLLAEVEGGLRHPVREPTKDASILKGIGGFGFNGDPAESIITERNAKWR